MPLAAISSFLKANLKPSYQRNSSLKNLDILQGQKDQFKRENRIGHRKGCYVDLRCKTVAKSCKHHGKFYKIIGSEFVFFSSCRMFEANYSTGLLPKFNFNMQISEYNVYEGIQRWKKNLFADDFIELGDSNISVLNRILGLDGLLKVSMEIFIYKESTYDVEVCRCH